ncbi:XK-related protein 6 [Portunus trituberculatus]|uniref:XK-related protein n=1 Tax=Portunus trituberculatus TaxID=210409 RepID=A0A5B7CX88_PORTR|nr:XK-related protein 6 [Portunus trituberculatus]
MYWKRGDTQRQKQFYTWMLYEDADSVFLRMFECFMESAPQLILQLYILTQIQAADDSSKYGKTTRYLIFCGSITSLVSLAWGVMAYARGCRFTQLEKNNISLLGSSVIFLWHLFCLAARVTALVLFASCFRMVVMWVCLGHWAVMAICLLLFRAFKEACTSIFSEFLMSVVFGVVYIFVFLNYKDEPTRWKYMAYYTVWEIENVVLVMMFLFYADSAVWYYIPAVVFHIVAFAVGLVFMGIYYTQLHPTKYALPTLSLPGEQNNLTQPPEDTHQANQTEL